MLCLSFNKNNNYDVIKLKIKILLLLLLSFSLSAQESSKIKDFVDESVSKSKQSNAPQMSPIQKNDEGVAIDGYDPVAYFDEDAAVKGSSIHSCEYLNTTWHFSSAENRDKFLDNPDKFVPQYGGYCAHSITNKKVIQSNPESFSVVDDKLYFYRNNRLQKRDSNADENVFAKKKAQRDNNWLTFESNF